MTGHGFRGLASTILNEMGYERVHIEMQLAHAPSTTVVDRRPAGESFVFGSDIEGPGIDAFVSIATIAADVQRRATRARVVELTGGAVPVR